MVAWVERTRLAIRRATDRHRYSFWEHLLLTVSKGKAKTKQIELIYITYTYIHIKRHTIRERPDGARLVAVVFTNHRWLTAQL